MSSFAFGSSCRLKQFCTGQFAYIVKFAKTEEKLHKRNLHITTPEWNGKFGIKGPSEA